MDRIITHLEFANDWSQIDQYALLGVIVQNNQGSATLLYIRIRINDRNKYEILFTENERLKKGLSSEIEQILKN